jgi:hypothetical protein
MDNTKFNEIVKPLLKYNKRAERDQLIQHHKACEYCYKLVKGQTVICAPIRWGTVGQHFRHRCLQCKAVIFDGSMKKDCNRRPNLLVSDELAK